MQKESDGKDDPRFFLVLLPPLAGQMKRRFQWMACPVI